MKLRNTLIAAVAGLALVAGHASASNTVVVDRIGAEDEGVSSLTLVGLAGGILATVLVNGSRADEAESA